MSDKIEFNSLWAYEEDRDCISFSAQLPDGTIDCLISSEALQYCFNDGSNEGKVQAFEANRLAINELAVGKIKAGAFEGEDLILIVIFDCEAHGFESEC
ncbi:DUF1488 family protein [Shewanella surugensis]|uniref:DUF1488 domain-containing protein n=1 Tax=Shewanella surugensis TaxID=212020 RepID=A0ABT0LCP5_9GAMM|nr:DUF1488 family protein [Shewanella surugensis]MCL1125110.1 DUF1488 domain-containing protein [Shewanella surugensis]